MKDTQTLIKVRSSVKSRLDLLKSNKSYGDIIDDMVSYFELTGIDPVSGRVPPVATFVKALRDGTDLIYKRIDDVIKIMRNIEANKIDIILHSIAGDGARNVEQPNSYSDEEVLQLIQLNESLKRKDIKNNQIIRDLQNEISKLNNNSLANEIVDIVEELLSDKVLIRSNNDTFYLTREHRNQLIEKIKTKIDV